MSPTKLFVIGGLLCALSLLITASFPSERTPENNYGEFTRRWIWIAIPPFVLGISGCVAAAIQQARQSGQFRRSKR